MNDGVERVINRPCLRKTASAPTTSGAAPSDDPPSKPRTARSGVSGVILFSADSQTGLRDLNLPQTLMRSYGHSDLRRLCRGNRGRRGSGRRRNRDCLTFPAQRHRRRNASRSINQRGRRLERKRSNQVTHMAERRRSPRSNNSLCGCLYFNNQRNAVDCLIRDISSQGARVIFSDAASVPDVVELYIPQKEQSVRARAVAPQRGARPCLLGQRGRGQRRAAVQRIGRARRAARVRGARAALHRPAAQERASGRQ